LNQTSTKRYHLPPPRQRFEKLNARIKFNLITARVITIHVIAFMNQA